MSKPPPGQLKMSVARCSLVAGKPRWKALLMASFIPNPNFEREAEGMLNENLGKQLRPLVQSVSCPDHPDRERPDLVRDGDGLAIGTAWRRA